MAKRVAIILAAGVSSRMNTKIPKVLHEVCGRPMLSYVVDACREAGVEKMYIVVGFGAEQVQEKFSTPKDKDIVWIYQEQQRGTAHAVMCCKEHLAGFDGETLVICGDMPLVLSRILKTIVTEHEKQGAAMTLATSILDDPTGYGRIVRDKKGDITAIVEHNDCSEEQLAIQEVNPSYYLFDNKKLFETLEKVRPNNIKHEYYITDTLEILLKGGHKVIAVTAVRPEEAMGVNSRQQLSVASKIMQQRIQKNLMDNGVTIVDPENTWIDVRAKIGQDTVIEPFTYIHGEVEIGRSCRIGPFAYIREGAAIKDKVVLGVFTEVQNSTLGYGVCARHHSYIGDAVLGEKVNIGAGAIVVNSDGKKAGQTKIGDNSRIGAGAILVSPLELGNNSHVEAGAVVSSGKVEKIGRGG